MTDDALTRALKRGLAFVVVPHGNDLSIGFIDAEAVKQEIDRETDGESEWLQVITTLEDCKIPSASIAAMLQKLEDTAKFADMLFEGEEDIDEEA